MSNQVKAEWEGLVLDYFGVVAIRTPEWVKDFYTRQMGKRVRVTVEVLGE